MGLKPDLFAALADLAGCMYISDLQYLPRCQVLSAVQQLSAEQFPARDWIDALCYFSDQHQWLDPKVHNFSTDYARSQLISYLAEYSEINV